VIRHVVTFCLILIQFCSLNSWAKGVPAPKADWKFVEKRLQKSGFKPDFVKNLKAFYDPDQFAEVLELNTLLFLKKTDYHGVQVTPEAATTVRGFVELNHEALEGAEKTFGVPKEIVASLLWMESRQGKNTGQFHVASVFLDLLQADRPGTVLYLQHAGTRFTDKVTAQNRKDIASRAKKRVQWALGELKAIQKMRKDNPNVVRELRGSFAGAFGMPQFEPSSYVAYAKAYKNGEVADLGRTDDAIQSVANYLRLNGWKKNKPKSYVLALMHYNNSHDYANAILKLAGQASPTEEKSKRTPARVSH